jgi:probable HAF family extracellular repeat protein
VLAFTFAGFFGLVPALRADLIFTSVNITGNPFGINNAGQIVGTSIGGQFTDGFLYSRGVVYSLSVPGALNTFAYGINDSSQIVGAFSGPGSSSGFIQTGGVFVPISVPGATGTTARGINDLDEIVGYFSDVAGRQTGFLSTVDSGLGSSGFAATSFTNISVPGSISTFPYSINNNGQIVGYFTDASGVSSGFMFQGGVYHTINIPGSTDTFVYGINDLGQMVGSFIDRSGTHGFVESNGVFTPFDAPGTLPTSGTFARDINDSGQILVFGSGAGTFLATETEIPEPNTLVLSAAVIAGMVFLRTQVRKS